VWSRWWKMLGAESPLPDPCTISQAEIDKLVRRTCNNSSWIRTPK
jgi:hypothetical protein